MSISNLTMDEFSILLENMNRIFQPRSYWGSPGAFNSEIDAKLLTVLAICNDLNHITIEKEETEAVDLPSYYDVRSLGDDECEFYQVASNRRGNDDLKDQTWSSYLYLKNKFPDGEFQCHGDQAPYFYEEVKSKTIIMAGNVTPRVILKIVADNKYKRLCIIGQKYEKKGEYYYSTDKLEVTSLSFSDRSLEEISKKLHLV